MVALSWIARWGPLGSSWGRRSKSRGSSGTRSLWRRSGVALDAELEASRHGGESVAWCSRGAPRMGATMGGRKGPRAAWCMHANARPRPTCKLMHTHAQTHIVTPNARTPVHTWLPLRHLHRLVTFLQARTMAALQAALYEHTPVRRVRECGERERERDRVELVAGFFGGRRQSARPRTCIPPPGPPGAGASLISHHVFEEVVVAGVFLGPVNILKLRAHRTRNNDETDTQAVAGAAEGGPSPRIGS